MKRQSAKTITELLSIFLRNQGLQGELERIEIFEAWDKVVGIRAANATQNKFFKDGILHCTVNSSALRSSLYFQLEAIKEQINSELRRKIVTKIVLK